MTAQEKRYQLDQASTGSEGWADNDVLQVSSRVFTSLAEIREDDIQGFTPVEDLHI